MEPLTLHQISTLSQSRLERGAGRVVTSHINSDTRTLEPGELFLALRGENFDGHNYVAEAAGKGACGALVSEGFELPTALPEDFAILTADDSLKAYQRLAHEYRKLRDIRIVGITGSNGKTSTKDLTAAAFNAGGKKQVRKTRGNLNNHIGVPRTLLTLSEADDVGVIEAGMNSVGEIELLARLMKPDGAIITNIGTAHIGMLGSREAIAREKGMLGEALEAEGFLVLPERDDFRDHLASRTRARVLTGGIGEGDLRAENPLPEDGGTRFELHTPKGRAPLEVFIPLQGRHMVINATLALAAVFASEPDLLEAAAANLAKAEMTGGRLQIRREAGLQFLDDSYNANPDSMIAALTTLTGMCRMRAERGAKGKAIAILGSMGELGEFEHEGYERVGREAGSLGVDVLLAVNVHDPVLVKSAGDAGVNLVEACPDHETAAHRLTEIAGAQDLILLKGSRAAAMEKILDHLS